MQEVHTDNQEEFTNTLASATDENQVESVKKLWEIFNEAYEYSRTEKTGEAMQPREMTLEDFDQTAKTSKSNGWSRRPGRILSTSSTTCTRQRTPITGSPTRSLSED